MIKNPILSALFWSILLGFSSACGLEDDLRLDSHEFGEEASVKFKNAEQRKTKNRKGVSVKAHNLGFLTCEVVRGQMFCDESFNEDDAVMWDYWCQDGVEWEDCGGGQFEKTGYACEGTGWVA